jgi:tetratricopeptide (TPR) repeat protein
MCSLAEAYLKVGLLEEAASWFKKTISLKKSHENAWLGQIAAMEAIHASGKGNTDELALLYEEYLRVWPGNLNIRRDRAMFLIKTFHYAEASGELEQLLVWEPSNPSLRRVLAYTYRKTGRYREAAVLLKALLKENPRDSGLIIEYSACLDRAGAAYYALELLAKAKEFFENSNMGPNEPRGSKKLKSPLKSKGFLKQISFLEPKSSLEPRICDICLALGVINYRQKNVEKSFDFFREAAAINKADPRPYEWMATIARKNGESSASYYEKEAQKRKKQKN